MVAVPDLDLAYLSDLADKLSFRALKSTQNLDDLADSLWKVGDLSLSSAVGLPDAGIGIIAAFRTSQTIAGQVWINTYLGTMWTRRSVTASSGWSTWKKL